MCVGACTMNVLSSITIFTLTAVTCSSSIPHALRFNFPQTKVDTIHYLDYVWLATDMSLHWCDLPSVYVLAIPSKREKSYCLDQFAYQIQYNNTIMMKCLLS